MLGKLESPGKMSSQETTTVTSKKSETSLGSGIRWKIKSSPSLRICSCPWRNHGNKGRLHREGSLWSLGSSAILHFNSRVFDLLSNLHPQRLFDFVRVKILFLRLMRDFKSDLKAPRAPTGTVSMAGNRQGTPPFPKPMGSRRIRSGVPLIFF